MVDEDQYEYLDKSDLADIIFFLRKGVLTLELLMRESEGVYWNHEGGNNTSWCDLVEDGRILDISKAIEVAHEQV